MLYLLYRMYGWYRIILYCYGLIRDLMEWDEVQRNFEMIKFILCGALLIFVPLIIIVAINKIFFSFKYREDIFTIMDPFHSSDYDYEYKIYIKIRRGKNAGALFGNNLYQEWRKYFVVKYGDGWSGFNENEKEHYMKVLEVETNRKKYDNDLWATVGLACVSIVISVVVSLISFTTVKDSIIIFVACIIIIEIVILFSFVFKSIKYNHIEFMNDIKYFLNSKKEN